MGVSIVPKNRDGYLLPHRQYPSHSYSGFHVWRQEVCDFLGRGNLRDFASYGGTKERPSKYSEPLVWILHHSDCEGYIRTGLPRIKKRLEDFYSRQAGDDSRYEKNATRLRINSLDECIKNKGRICFY